jgi:hypothetical protein
VLWLNRDVDPLLALGPTMALGTGGEIKAGAGPTPTWLGPEGWLPDVPPGGLLGLRWDGQQLTVATVDDAAAADSPRTQDVRRLLAAHASARQRGSWPYAAAAPLTAVVLSALVEDPELFRSPLPPLSELLPLPEDQRPQDGWPPHGDIGADEVLHVPVPMRVHRELARRADLLGDRLPQYAAMLLGAAADRVLPAERRSYETYDDYGGLPAYDNVVTPSRWAR